MSLSQKLINNSLIFVPKHNPVCEADLKHFSDFLLRCKRLLILTGAGISTESGIPDYRSDGVGLYARSNSRPLQYQIFIKSYEARRRYWARNYVGWSRFSSFQPNGVHLFLRDLELEYHKVSSIITQNVDNLHFEAGSKRVIELHGTGFRVVCLGCDMMFSRHYIQDMLKFLNPNMIETSQYIRPDGDVELSDDDVKEFTMPTCPSCHGILKPDIVFFGENVPKETTRAVDKEINFCDSLLILGSSLSTYSGLRIALKSKELRKPLAIVNIGPTRGDNIADIKIGKRCGELLSKISLSKLCRLV
ncbi:NAD-dependent protein deacylase Sirt4-like [Lycorma delicatula]|uniref:NAD-dependent protein deacylase Sirt4-like n=1 Tax=Lycorma delicatula TaxID=130591 RepID=UPI003F51909D